MTLTLSSPPQTPVEPVTEVLHGVSITDPYRWLEDQNSLRTRKWIEEQTAYARCYLDSIPGREETRKRVLEFLEVETCDSLQHVGKRYFFRKRLPQQEQACLYMRDGEEGEDMLLLDPSGLGQGNHTAVRLLCASPDGRLLLYEVKEGGTETGTFRVFDVERRRSFQDEFPANCLHGFAFGTGARGFYYVLETPKEKGTRCQIAYQHILGKPCDSDREILRGGEGDWLRLTASKEHLGLVVYHNPLNLENVRTDFYLLEFARDAAPRQVFSSAKGIVNPALGLDRLLAFTNSDARNFRIVEIKPQENNKEPKFIDVVPESDLSIQSAIFVRNRIYVSYLRETSSQVLVFDFFGNKLGTVPVSEDETVNLIGGSRESDELLFETESFTQPQATYRYSTETQERKLWSRINIPFAPTNYAHHRVTYTSKDGTRIPMFLMGRRDVLESGIRPVVMTSYGGFGLPSTPQFSILVALLVEKGCLFALPNIRGGCEFGADWHLAAKRRQRQKAYDDFLCAAEWLIENERTVPEKLAIFGGSNSGLLVGVALTQRPDLFRAALCLVPILDMLRYHLFDKGDGWQDEFGTADDPEDFAALAQYSPYHNVRSGVAYPATMLVSGDADRRCNPFHTRKMTARLQAANTSERPILLDYSKHRGHFPVLPLSERVEALTDRIAFLSNQLGLQA